MPRCLRSCGAKPLLNQEHAAEGGGGLGAGVERGELMLLGTVYKQRVSGLIVNTAFPP